MRQTRRDWPVDVVLAEDGPLATRCWALGANVHLLSFTADIARLGDSSSAGSTRIAMDLAGTTADILSYRHRLHLLLTELRPQLIHCNGFKMHLLGAVAKPPSSKLVWHVHDYVTPRAMIARLFRQLSHRPDAIITNSNSVAEDVRSLIAPEHGRKVHPIINVVDLTEFSPEGNRLDLDRLSDLPPAPNGTIRVGLLATMAWWKGHRLFLEALAKLDPQLPVRGYIIGGSVYQTGSKQETVEDLRQYAGQLGISSRVGFTGFIDSPAAAMRALDIVVHTSTEPEPFGRVIVEAMACGKPVISSGRGGAAEIARLGGVKVFRSGDASGLASAIAELAADTRLQQTLGGTGLSVARQHYARERLASELPLVYEKAGNSE
jgi:glycosyltransferase involved in cell wall biosynthesis